MKRKLSLLLAVVLAMTMVMGIGVTAFAAVDNVNITYGDFDFSNPTSFPTVTSSTGVVVQYYLLYFDQDGNFKIGYNTEDFWDENDDSISPSSTDFEAIEKVVVQVLVIEDTDESTTVTGLNAIDMSKLFRSESPYTSFPSTSSISEYTGYVPTNSYLAIQLVYERGSVTPFGSDSEKSSSLAHVHNFTWQTIYEATPNSDGLEGEVCSCGATRNTQPISAMDYAINKYADQMIKAAKPGQKITLEFGEFNSFPRYMMEKVAARMNENITFVFKFKQNKKMQTVTIEPETAIDLQYDWYGPDKMKELYGAE